MRNWSHPSLEEDGCTHSVRGNFILRGRIVIALYAGKNVFSPSGELIGIVESPAHAMLMAMRHEESNRWSTANEGKA